jgi:serine/threonine-protein kinase
MRARAPAQARHRVTNATDEHVRLITLLASDLVGSTGFIERLGDERAAGLFRRHDRLARDLMAAHGGREIDKTDGFLSTFSRPTDSVAYAIALHDALAELSKECGETLEARVGIHVGEVVLRESDPADVARGAKPVDVEGLAKPLVTRIMSLAAGRQTLLTRVAFDLSRRSALKGALADGSIAWLAHGAYIAKGINEPIEVFEVGRVGLAPLAAPVDTEKVRAVPDPNAVVGWRPAPGVEMPGRPNWVLRDKLGGGGFGDVWRAQHRKTGESRAFKFCYDLEQLKSLKREVTLVRLLKEQLGDRREIARILDWNFDEVPYFIESEWTDGGSLADWIERRGGPGAVPLAVRVEIVAQVADALAAAHSVGILHKDVKPANILMTEDPDGTPRAKLTDFGIGALTDRKVLAGSGITQIGFTALIDDDDESSMAGTHLYMAPELLEHKAATVHADVYALGVVLYQLVAADLSRALSSGWERDIADPLLREDIAAAVDGHPEQRIDVRSLSDRLRRLDARRREREQEARSLERAERARKRRTLFAAAAAAVLLVSVATAVQLRRVALEARRANREAETNKRQSEFMAGLFRLADPGESRGNTVTAREILDEGARKIDRDLSDQPEVQATLMATMGNVYVGLGLAKVAKPILERSLAIRQRVYGEQAAETADGQALLGDAERDVGDFARSQEHFARAVQIRTKLFGPNDASVAQALAGLGSARWRLGKIDSAAADDHRAIAIYRAAGKHPADLAGALSVLANLEALTRRYASADTLLTEALALTSATFGPEDRRTAQMMNNLGLTLVFERRYDEAERYLRGALALHRKLLGDDHPLVATSSAALAALLRQRGKYAEAEALYRRALEIYRARLGPQQSEAFSTMSSLAWVLADDNKCAEAEGLAKSAQGGLTRVFPKGHWVIALNESILGECLGRRGAVREAEPLLVESYPVLKKSPGGMWAEAAAKRLVSFYERRGDRVKAEEYRRELAATTAKQ